MRDEFVEYFKRLAVSLREDKNPKQVEQMLDAFRYLGLKKAEELLLEESDYGGHVSSFPYYIQRAELVEKIIENDFDGAISCLGYFEELSAGDLEKIKKKLLELKLLDFISKKEYLKGVEFVRAYFKEYVLKGDSFIDEILLLFVINDEEGQLRTADDVNLRVKIAFAINNIILQALNLKWNFIEPKLLEGLKMVLWMDKKIKKSNISLFFNELMKDTDDLHQIKFNESSREVEESDTEELLNISDSSDEYLN